MMIKKIINSHSTTILKKILGYILLFNPKFYWKYIDLENKKNHFDFLIQDKHLKNMFDSMEGVQFIMEFGCGFGDRLFNLASNNNYNTFHGYDLNTNRIKKGNYLLDKENITNVALFNDLSQLNTKYDLVFTSMTLIYFKEKEIFEIIQKIINMSNRYIILQEVLSEKEFVHKSTLFAYNYNEILKKFGITKFKIEKIDNSNWQRSESVYGANIFIDLKNL